MNRSTIIASAIFAVLLLGAALVLMQKPESGMSRFSLAGAKKDAVTRVELGGNQAAELNKDKGLWLLADGKQADQAAVERLIDSSLTMASSNLVTRDAGRYADLEVDETKGEHVRLLSGKRAVADFFVGKAATSGASYVRLDKAVYLVPSTNRASFARANASWLEHRLFDDKLEDVTRVEVKLHGQGPYALVKNDNKWQVENAAALPKGFRFDANAAQALVSSLVNVRGQDVVEPDPGDAKTGLSEAAADVLTFHVRDASRQLFLGAANEAKASYARGSARPLLWTLPEYAVKALRKVPVDFRDLTLVSLDAAKVKDLEIRDGGRRLSFSKKADGWAVTDSSEKTPPNFTFDPTMVDRRISALSGARGSAWAAVQNAQSSGLSAPAATVTAKLEDGKSVTLAFGAATKLDNQNGFFARGNADEGIYVVAEWTRKNLTGGLETFAKRAAPNDNIANLDPKMLSNLPPDIRASLEKQIAQKREQQKMLEALQKQSPKPPAKP